MLKFFPDMETSKSDGHLAFIGEYEYFRVKTDIYKANVDNPLSDFQGDKLRVGARWECTTVAWDSCKKLRESQLKQGVSNA